MVGSSGVGQSGKQGKVASASVIAFGKTRNQRGIGPTGLLPGGNDDFFSPPPKTTEYSGYTSPLHRNQSRVFIAWGPSCQ
jgi:hypothetical protein